MKTTLTVILKNQKIGKMKTEIKLENGANVEIDTELKIINISERGVFICQLSFSDIYDIHDEVLLKDTSWDDAKN